MAERSEQRTREDTDREEPDLSDLSIDDADEDALAGMDPTETIAGNRDSYRGDAGNHPGEQGRLGSLRERLTPSLSVSSLLPDLFSPRSFVIALGASIVGAIAFGMVIPVFGSIASLGGIFAAGFGFGILGNRRRYLEVGLAGGATAAIGALTEFLVVTLAGSSGLLAMVGAGSGAIAALLGHYFGRDLRSGLTRDI